MTSAALAAAANGCFSRESPAVPLKSGNSVQAQEHSRGKRKGKQESFYGGFCYFLAVPAIPSGRTYSFGEGAFSGAFRELATWAHSKGVEL
jgi:hypothetical protein